MHDFTSAHPYTCWVFSVLIVGFLQWAQSVWGLFSKEPLIPMITEKFRRMRVPNFSVAWITTTAGLLSLMYICYVEAHKAAVLPSPQGGVGKSSSLIIDTNYDVAFNAVKLSRNPIFELEKLGLKAFDDGKYAYCHCFFGRPFKIEGDSHEWALHRPLYEAALWASNPNPDTRATFHTNLDSILRVIERASTANATDGLYGYYRASDVLASVYSDLSKIENLLPEGDSERKHIGDIAEQVLKFKPVR